MSEDWNDAKAAAAEYAAAEPEPEVPGVGVEPWGVYTSSGDCKKIGGKMSRLKEMK